MMPEAKNPRVTRYSDVIADALTKSLQTKIALVSLEFSIEDCRLVLQGAAAKFAAEAAIGCTALATADHLRVFDEAAETIAGALVTRRSDVTAQADLQQVFFKIFGIDPRA